MTKFKDMTPMQRLDAMRKAGVTLYPNLSAEDKRAVLYVENEPTVAAQDTNKS
ncbi:hypothetical protein KGP17_27515 (plasmid) [Serratia sp. JSRIV001]|uniref:hypothetical protein n=1 Tax=unclassified Serratia (in: enterobacteria) TaxID=2647522 RepID=UPI001CBC697D|nr:MULTISPECIES: hypothetical protein [unclassified Serratia (in: enterobacteria)]UAN48769.1 hypothetical protein KGP17_27515 [Serratia sp. JSRIV001]UAN54480.1 hypothetical protein KGP26_28870 [Serratia sp. JSRIV002]UAN60600.1 hypothetical protein KGP21_29120 [Serratia sp. JSRIV004]